MNALPPTRLLSCIAFCCAMSSPFVSVAEGVTNRPLPALLRDATARGGWLSPCPPKDDVERKMIESSGQLAIFPEVDRRLKERFPPGSAARRLEDELDAEGFRPAGRCSPDPSISIATYRKPGTGFLGTGGISAAIYWKIDAANAIVWATGIVTHGGP